MVREGGCTMEKKDRSAIDEVLEYVKAKAEEGKKNVGETLGEEARRIQDIIDFAKSKLDGVTDEAKLSLNEVISFAQSKLEQIQKEALEAKEKVEEGTEKVKETADELVEKVSEEAEEVKETVRKTGITDTVVSAAKSFGGTLADLGKKLGKETKQLTEIASLRWEISSLVKTRKEKITNLGESVYEVHKSGETQVPVSADLQEMIAEIEEIEKKIDMKQAEVDKLAREEDLTAEDLDSIDKELEKETKKPQ
jgi:chromosome segregation ATPase